MKPKRALFFTMAVVLTLCGACGVWLHTERQQYERNRQLIASLVKGDTKTALVLVNAGADPNTRQAPTPAPSLSQLFKHLLHHTPPPTNDSETVLTLACVADARKRDVGSETAVSEEATLPLFRALLSHGANVNARAGDYATVLNCAVLFQNPRIVELLLQHGASPNIPDDVGRTPLMMATALGSANMARLLLAHGANPNVQDTDGDAALYYALSSPLDKTLISDLLAHGADPNLPDKQGTTPLQFAQQAKRPDLVRLLTQGAK